MTTTADTPLRAWLDDAHETHAQAPQRVAQALLARAPTLPDDAEGAEALRLAEHVMLGHLGDAAMLSRLLDRLPAHPALAEARTRATWALQRLQAAAPPGEVPEAEAWRAMQNVALAWVQQGRAGDAADWLRAHEPQAAAHADEAVRRAAAATANNIASHLRDALHEGLSGGAAQADAAQADAAGPALMLEAAAMAHRLWAVAGSWVQVERADYQRALCHAVLGQGPPALQHAGACMALCEREGADAAERFFAHEALARAHRAQMQALLAEIDDPAMQAWCRRVLAAPMRP